MAKMSVAKTSGYDLELARELAGEVDDPRFKELAEKLADPKNADKDLKLLAISCGMNVMELSDLFRNGALAKAMYESSMVISKKMAKVVDNVLESSMDKGATFNDRRLALELCGLIDKKGSKGAINVNVGCGAEVSGGSGRTKGSRRPQLFEENIKNNTISVKTIPEEKDGDPDLPYVGIK